MLALRWLIAILALPCTVLVAVPALLLWLTCQGHWAERLPSFSTPQFWVALILGLGGLIGALWTTSLFFRFGEGTAAPWDPPKRFVVRGPYRHVRNPMLIAVMLILAAEALLFSSLALAVWLSIFVIGNVFYIPLVEEQVLARRFGSDYDEYRRQVPRWLPRLTPWEPSRPR